MLGPTPPEMSTPTRARGVQRLWDPRVWGTTIGAAGGTVFVMVNHGDLGDPWSTAAVGAWAGALVAYLWFVLVVPRWFEPPAEVGRRAGLVYVLSVAGMLMFIRLWSELLDHADRSELRPALIATAVGLHFLPFAAEFGTPMFWRLGLVMAGIGGAGVVLGWVVDGDLAAWAAVLGGVVMIVIITADAARGHAARDLTDEQAPGRG